MYEQWPAAACRWSRSGTCRHGVGRSRFAANSSNRCTQLIAKSASLSCPCTHHTLCVQCIACVICIMAAPIVGTADKRDDFCGTHARPKQAIPRETCDTKAVTATRCLVPRYVSRLTHSGGCASQGGREAAAARRKGPKAGRRGRQTTLITSQPRTVRPN